MSIAIAELEEGESLEFEGVRFRVLNGELEVDSFSDWAPDRATPLHAQEKIARSKAVLEELAQLSPAFAEIANRSLAQFVCCYDYGTGTLALARERSGRFEWLLGNA